MKFPGIASQKRSVLVVLARTFLLPIGLMLGSMIALLISARYESQFRLILQEGFQARVELGDLASSIQGLRRTLETPRVFDPSFVTGLAELTAEVERKLKSQSSAGRVQELVLPSKELSALRGMDLGFKSLVTNVSLVERALYIKQAQRAPEVGELPAIKRFSGLLEQYGTAASLLRNSKGAGNVIPDMKTVSAGIAEQFPLALAESRRKGVPAVWREILALFPPERNELADRLLADSRLLDDFDAQRNRAINRLEQVSARVDAAERLLLQSKTGSELSVVSLILQALGIGLAILSGIFAARQGYLHGRSLGEPSEAAEEAAVLVEEQEHSDELRRDQQVSANPVIVESVIAARLNEALNAQNKAAKLDLSSAVVNEEAEINSAEVAEGYWIPAGSMAERRIALLDRQSEQLEGRVGSVMAASETLSGRIDLVVQSLHLLSDRDTEAAPNRSASLRSRLESLRVNGMNLSLQLSSGEGGGDFFEALEQFNDQLADLSDEFESISDFSNSQNTSDRRLRNTLEEGRRLQAASDALRERTQLLLEDAQRFRRHSEALIRGIQEGAVSNYPASAVRGKLPS